VAGLGLPVWAYAWPAAAWRLRWAGGPGWRERFTRTLYPAAAALSSSVTTYSKMSTALLLVLLALALLLLAAPSTASSGGRRSWTAADYGATPDDGKDDTLALRWALGNCSATGGAVRIPAGHYIVSPFTVSNGGSLPEGFPATVEMLPVPSNCHVYGDGRDGLRNTTIVMSTTGGSDDQGVNGVDGCWWRMFGWCPHRPCINPPSNLTITDLHLSGSTNWTGYGNSSIAGQREHGSLIFFYAANGTSVIKGITVERIFAEKSAGDCMDFGDGVQDLLVSDIIQRDCLRTGVDQAGYGPLSRNREIRFVRDLPGTPGVGQGNTIHAEETNNLTNVWIHHNNCSMSLQTSGLNDSRIENNVVFGQILGNGNRRITIFNNTIHQLRPYDAYSEYGDSPMISQGFVQGANISFNRLVVSLLACRRSE
jgi:hypothetical protein